MRYGRMRIIILYLKQAQGSKKSHQCLMAGVGVQLGLDQVLSSWQSLDWTGPQETSSSAIFQARIVTIMLNDKQLGPLAAHSNEHLPLSRLGSAALPILAGLSTRLRVGWQLTREPRGTWPCSMCLSYPQDAGLESTRKPQSLPRLHLELARCHFWGILPVRRVIRLAQIQGAGTRTLVYLVKEIAKSLGREDRFGVMVVRNWGPQCKQSTSVPSPLTEEHTTCHRRNRDVPKVITQPKAHYSLRLVPPTLVAFPLIPWAPTESHEM